MAEPKQRAAHDQVLSILDDLDSFTPPPKPQSNITSSSNNNNSSGDAQSVLDFIDEITQRSSTPTPSINTKSLNPSRPVSRVPSTLHFYHHHYHDQRPTIKLNPTNLKRVLLSTWGWGSVLKQATSTVLNQAKSAAGQVQSVVSDPSKSSSDIVRNFNHKFIADSLNEHSSDYAKKFKEGVIGYVRATGIDQFSKDLQATGIKSLNEIMNIVVPPISKHEIIDVQLSYDMVGYDGIETLVYRSLSKVMEQVDGGDLILNKGDEEKLKNPDQQGIEPERNLHAIEGMTEGYKLALANLEQMIKRIEAKKKAEQVNKPPKIMTPAEEEEEKEKDSRSKEEETNSDQDLPITHCPVYVRIQPILSRLPMFTSVCTPTVTINEEEDKNTKVGGGGITVDQEPHLFFLILLRDVKNSLDHATITQSTPAIWLDIPFEDNEWVEDVLVDVIRRGVEIIGQQYVNGRISGRSIRNTTTGTDPPKQEPDQKQESSSSSSELKPVPSSSTTTNTTTTAEEKTQ
ncbi:hypothetical protein PSHT_06233 [Puccinia striiformis]|uniref:Maintenance of telomere capping protein 1 n=1 Tax=Puccinia striiformis TaxID=27350 RepID=A0A2S4W7P1_9BASI|nr:hypothetical protein PSHT_06233 [Puccinia striiformis]